MTAQIITGDARHKLKELADGSVNCCVTSPPYFGLRDYGHGDQIGLEPTPEAYVEELVALFREVRRVLANDGTVWLNLGDSYARNPAKGQHKPGDSGKQGYIYDRGGGRASSTALADLPEKNLIGIPWRVAFALQADGWYLRQDIIWYKPNVMPESVQDRCTKAHEYIFLLTKGPRYYYDAEAIEEDTVCDRVRGPALHRDTVSTNGNGGLSRRPVQEMRNKRSVWAVPTKPFIEAHFATFPPALIEPCIKAGCPEGGTVLDPFGGAGTTGLVADRLGRNAILIELNPEYAEMADRRIKGDAPLLVGA